MRISCNGCRVLRKGCGDNCSIRPCLEWIKSPDSQANATVFLAKFYGRAGLMNLINAGPSNLRPAIFRSLLYEACGRIVNPIYGSIGLLWSDSWQLCHSAVEAVLRGAPVTQMTTEPKDGPPLKAYDIRHVNKEHKFPASNDLRRVRNRCRFKRSGKRARASPVNVSISHDSSLSHQSEAAAEPAGTDHESRDGDSSMREDDGRGGEEGEIELELMLGFEPFSRCAKTPDSAAKRAASSAAGESGFCQMELRLDCPTS
ncbi:LOB domain-containing protein 40-like [Salvia miltiorrhiza]|uniref:LOB domain-containing protein 40-like n=1 Tax=Salvia miltiorrhiza TaxID=226208 RepID=UPI0025AD0524|nr:LOB domain-containing protein 40-like [Salvia miltiorrhiza]